MQVKMLNNAQSQLCKVLPWLPAALPVTLPRKPPHRPQDVGVVTLIFIA
jgi:hypothetical protein